MGQVLLVEDDADIAEPLGRALAREGHEVRRAVDGPEAIAAVAETPDLVILDLGLPGLSGMEVCRRLRAADARLPVLILSARDSELDVVAGLDAGADDYVTKPFHLAELLARVRAALRGREHSTLGAADVRVDCDARRAWRGERELTLAPREFDLLALLVREAGVALPRQRIMDEVWDRNWFGSTKTLDVHVAFLRRKLGPPPLLTTVCGVGFRFDG